MDDISLVLLTSVFVVGIVLGSGWSWSLPLLYALIAVLGVMVVAYLRSQQQRALFLLVLLFILLGMIRFIHDDIVSPNDISHFTERKVLISGKIADNPQVTAFDGEKKVRYLVEVNNIQTDGKAIKTVGQIMVSVRQTSQSIVGNYNDFIQLSGELTALHGYNNPGAIDAVAAWKRQGIGARMSEKEDHIQIVANEQKGIRAKIIEWRNKLAALFAKAMPETDAAILSGVLFGGGYGSIQPGVLRDFAATGIIHILSVSGSHIALVTAVMLWLGERSRMSMVGKVVMAGGAMVVYSLLAGLTPPVIRAIIMGMVALVALLSEREQYGPGALSLAALVMLAWKPSLLYDISFQLSFAGTAGLVFFYSKTTKILENLPRWLASGIAVTISSQVGMLPFLAWYFHNLPLGSILANLIVVPIIELVIILGLAASVAALVLNGLAHVLLVVCSLIIGVAVTINKVIAAIPGLQWYLPPFSSVTGILYYLLLAWVYGYLPRVLPFTTVVTCWPWRTAAVIVIIGMVVGGWALLPRPVAVHFIDVGQGDATLVITPHGRAVLIDTGGTVGDSNRFDIGERVVVPYLKHQGITALDFLILTHGHQDHAGGAAAVASAVTVKNVIVAPEQFTDSIKALLRNKKYGMLIPAVVGQRIVLDGVTIEIVHDGDSSAEPRGGNETSSVIRIAYGQHSFLITGDLEAQQEAYLSSRGFESCTVLKVAHHGARTSSTDGFLQQARPLYAAISVGANNRFGHPHGEVLYRLKQTGAQLYRTDLNGAILFKTDGVKLTVHPYKP